MSGCRRHAVFRPSGGRGIRGTAVVLLLLVLAAGAPAPAQENPGDEGPHDPLTVSVRRADAALEITLVLSEPLPEPMLEALPSGAQVSVQYRVQVKGKRALIWDKKIWKGQVVASVVFDPLTGRYRCEEILDEVIVASTETPSVEEAREWLRAPPPFRVILPKTRRILRLRARAVLAVGTTWLVFPSVDGTRWVEVTVGDS